MNSFPCPECDVHLVRQLLARQKMYRHLLGHGYTESEAEEIALTVPVVLSSKTCGCPLCGHSPVYKEDPKDGATHTYYCHGCNRGFDTIPTALPWETVKVAAFKICGCPFYSDCIHATLEGWDG